MARIAGVDLPRDKRGEIAIHVGMAAVHDAADAFGAGGFRLLDHHVDVVGETCGDRPSLLLGERLCQRIANRQVLVEEDRARNGFGSDVL